MSSIWGTCHWYLVGDNPIIAIRGNDHYPLKCLSKIIFPISGKVLLMATGEPIKGNALDRNFILDCNLAIIEQSQRFVAFSDENFLRAVVGLYKQDLQLKKSKSLTENLFLRLNVLHYERYSFLSTLRKWFRKLENIIKNNDSKKRD